MRMPFGRYRGWDLEDIPQQYLFWLHGQDLREPLKTFVNLEYQRRCDAERDRGDHVALVDARTLKTAREIIQAGYRSLASKHHPDAGGSHEAMVEINSAVEWLRGHLEQAG